MRCKVNECLKILEWNSPVYQCEAQEKKKRMPWFFGNFPSGVVYIDRLLVRLLIQSFFFSLTPCSTWREKRATFFLFDWIARFGAFHINSSFFFVVAFGLFGQHRKQNIVSHKYPMPVLFPSRQFLCSMFLYSKNYVFIFAPN